MKKYILLLMALLPFKALSGDPVVIINGTPIDRSVIDNHMKQFTGAITREEYSQKVNEYIHETINMHLKREFSKTLKDIEVTDEEVEKSIKTIREKIQEEKSLKGKTFEEILAFQGITIDDIRERQKDNIRYVKYIESLITEEEIKTEFEERKFFYDGSEVRLSEIVVVTSEKTEEEKKKAREKIEMINAIITNPDSDFTFRKLAELFSETQQASKGGDIGFISRITTKIPEKVAETAFRLKPGEVSGIIETWVGYHIVKVTDTKKGPLTTFEDIKPNIRTFLMYKKEEELLNRLRSDADIVFPDQKQPLQK